MSNIPLTAIPKPQFYNNQLLTVGDFQQESSFHTLHRELQTRLLYTSGILLGLEVTESTGVSGQILLSAGVAIDGNGTQIILVDEAEYKGKPVNAVSGSIPLNLSDASFFSKSWALLISYNQITNPQPNLWTIAPKLELLDATSKAPIPTATQVPLATIKVENTGTAQTPVLKLTITTDNRQTAGLQANKISEISATQISGTLSSDQLPDISGSKIIDKIGIAQIPDIPTTQITGDIDATQISGILDAAQIPSITANKISDKLVIAQIPDIPASMITGKLSASQLPPITSGSGINLQIDTPIINTLQNVSVSSTVSDGSTFTLTYMSGGVIITKDSTTDAAAFTKTGNTYTLSIPITQSTSVTLTATSSTGAVEQISNYIDLVLDATTYMTQLFTAKEPAATAVEKVIDQFGLQALSNNNIYTLTNSMFKGGYTTADIYQYISAYYKNLGFNYLGEYLTYQVALIKNLQS